MIFACIGAVSAATGYTIKDDLVPKLQDLGKEDASYSFKSPSLKDQPVTVRRCTAVTVHVAGDVPEGQELWLGTNLRGRKALVEPMDSSGDGSYKASISIGREQDRMQQRELDAVLVGPEAADWLRSVKDKRSLYDVASSKWLPGARVVASVDVKRDSASGELDCSGKK
ncbi:hypothetical protein ABZX90_40740 [Streptomyces sp. NPDC002935]|uniref:hypothetical protein n=1 Tax=Streptomyces sp. NPDC002935 TaxID=3154545 RepID=UPI0033AD9F5A